MTLLNYSKFQVKKGTTKSKNKSLDDFLDDSKEAKSVTFTKENLKHVHDEKRNQPRPPHKTQSAVNVTDSTTFKDKTTIMHHNYDKSRGESTSHRHSIELTPEKIEEIQAKERDAYDFGNLRAQLERRVSGDRPVNEFEEWRKAKAEELRSSLHDSTNIKRAMKKWISMDKANRGE